MKIGKLSCDSSFGVKKGIYTKTMINIAEENENSDILKKLNSDVNTIDSLYPDRYFIYDFKKDNAVYLSSNNDLKPPVKLCSVVYSDDTYDCFKSIHNIAEALKNLKKSK